MVVKLRLKVEDAEVVTKWYEAGGEFPRGAVVSGSVAGGDSGQSETIRGLEAKVGRLERELVQKAKEGAVVVPVVAGPSQEAGKLLAELAEAKGQALAAAEAEEVAINRILELENEVAELQAGFPDTAMQNLRAKLAEFEKERRDEENDGS